MTGSRNTRLESLLCQDLSSHAFRKCHAMDFDQIWLGGLKVKEFSYVQASVKVKIDQKRRRVHFRFF